MRRLLAPALLALSAVGPAFSEEAARPIGQLYIRGDGPIRIEAVALERLGAKAATHVEVRRHGRTVPSWVEDGALRFDAVHTATAHTVHAAYRLWLHAASLERQAPDRPLPTVARYVLDADRFYGALASARREVYGNPAPVWYLAHIPRAKATTLELRPRGIDTAAALTLEARIRTAHAGRVRVFARWGDRGLASAEASSASKGATLTWQVPAGEAPSEVVSLALSDTSPPIPKAPARDVSAGRGSVWIESITVSGPPDPASPPREVRTIAPQALTRIADPLAAAGSAQHVIIAVPALVEEAKRLAAHRSETGTPSAVVPVTGIYARYGHGEHTPLAIRAFVLDLLARKDAPLEYLLLAGDATFDRTDMLPVPTIPTLMARSIYNGATAADPLYVVASNGEIKGSPPIGRLPYRDAETLRAYVDRVIGYETKPPAHASRRMFRFITSEARFGPLIDRLIEGKFRGILTQYIAPAFDIEATYASTSSPFLWPPPELNDKVIEGLNAGALFFSYVGHGFAEGFDTLRVNGTRHRILHKEDVERVAIEGTPPVVFVIACTTAQFDTLEDGIGEALMKRARGPVAYWGASRICHPAYNGLMGQAIAKHMARLENATAPPRLGEILKSARDEVLHGKTMNDIRMAIRLFAGGAKIRDLEVEGAMMYTLLGDPALKIAFPRASVDVGAVVDGSDVVVQIQAPLPAGTTVHVSLELPRNRNSGDGRAVANPSDPASYPAIREKHAASNDWALARRDVTLADGRAEVRIPLGVNKPKGLVVKAWSIAAGDVHQGATVLD